MARDEAFAKLGQGHELDDECKRIIAEEWGFREVVCCKDCKYRDEAITIPAPDGSPYESFTFAKCPCRSFDLGDDFFCGKGKRKDGEQGAVS